MLLHIYIIYLVSHSITIVIDLKLYFACDRLGAVTRFGHLANVGTGLRYMNKQFNLLMLLDLVLDICDNEILFN